LPIENKRGWTSSFSSMDFPKAIEVISI